MAENAETVLRTFRGAAAMTDELVTLFNRKGPNSPVVAIDLKRDEAEHVLMRFPFAWSRYKTLAPWPWPGDGAPGRGDRATVERGGAAVWENIMRRALSARSVMLGEALALALGFLLAGGWHSAFGQSLTPPFDYPTVLGTSATQVLPIDPLRRRIIFFNPQLHGDHRVLPKPDHKGRRPVHLCAQRRGLDHTPPSRIVRPRRRNRARAAAEHGSRLVRRRQRGQHAEHSHGI